MTQVSTVSNVQKFPPLSELFRRAASESGAVAVLCTALDASSKYHRDIEYARFCTSIRATAVQPGLACTPFLNLAADISDHVPDRGENLLRATCTLAERAGLTLELRDGLCQLAVLLESYEDGNPRDLKKIIEDALAIPSDGSPGQQWVTLELLLIQARTFLALIEPERARLLLPQIQEKLSAWKQQENLLVDPLPPEQPEFELLIDLLHVQADVLAENQEFEEALDYLGGVAAKLKRTRVYPQTASWVDNAQVDILQHQGKVYLDWVEAIATEGEDPFAFDPQLECAKQAIATALEIVARHDTAWLSPLQLADLRILQAEIALEVLDTDLAEVALDIAAELLTPLSSSEPLTLALKERLESALEDLQHVRNADESESESENDDD